MSTWLCAFGIWSMVESSLLGLDKTEESYIFKLLLHIKLLNFIDMWSIIVKHKTDSSFKKQTIATKMEIFVYMH